MTQEEKAVSQFIRTSNATVKVVVNLINDLAPIIGYNEAERLLGFYKEAQADMRESKK